MKILITGITGQVGSYLAEILLSSGHDVYGVKRRSSTDTLQNLSSIISNPSFTILEGDITDQCSITDIIRDGQYDRIYHMAAQSHVATSFKQPVYTTATILYSTMYILEAIKNYSPQSRMFYAATSEMFGNNYSSKYTGNNEENQYLDSNSLKDVEHYQNELTDFCPKSPYAIAKLAGLHLVRLYRESYGLYACCGIMFNMESPRRGEFFVTRKITKYVAKLQKNRTMGVELPPLPLGNLEARRDWGYAKDYALAISQFLTLDTPTDMVVSTGETYSIKEFLQEAFSIIGIDDYTKYIAIDPEYYRPSEVNFLRGDSTLLRKSLDWKPSVTFKELVNMMVSADILKESVGI